VQGGEIVGPGSKETYRIRHRTPKALVGYACMPSFMLGVKILDYNELDGTETLCPLRLCNEYDLGTTWTDFYQGHRKVARVYTHYYRHGKAVNGSTLPELLWVRAESDPDTESDEYS